MDNSELDKKLRAARAPSLGADYAANFAQSVLSRLRSVPARRTNSGRSWTIKLAWSLGTAAALLLAFTAGLWHGRGMADRDVLSDAKVIQETLAMFPNQVRAIVRDERGIRLVLSEQKDVPVSTPIYVRICDGAHCSSLVTFSGQEIQLAGKTMTVLSEANGGIILEGNEFVWSSSDPVRMVPGLRVQARFIQSQVL